MNTRSLRCWIVLSLLLSAAASTYAQQFYAVVGAFEEESNARKFTGYVHSQLYPAEYAVNATKDLFYVYVLKTTDRNAAYDKVKELQTESEFKNAWLFTGELGNHTAPTIANIAVPHPDGLQHTESVRAPEFFPIPQLPSDSASMIPVVTPEGEVKVKGKLFRFVLQTSDGKPVKGEVHNVDYRRGRDLATYRSDQYLDITRPSGEHNPMSLVCGVFGYKEVVKFLDYNDPSLAEGATRDAKGAWIIPYQLERMRKGDVSVMYHVSFYKDAVIMLPPSKVELDELVSMMQDNLNYRIVIHGHCNGNNARKIIALGPSKNYFNTTGSEEHTGTAKELSKMRAEAVQSYLADNGIDISRAEVHAWAAQNMLVPETSTSAKLNDRIEIEILQD